MDMTTLPALHIGSPVQAGPLTVFPVWTDAPLDTKPYRTKLPRSGRVGELRDGPSVPELRVTNPGAVPVLLFEGALLDGGWQHRVLASSVLVGAHADVTVEVCCVEQHRWGGGHDQNLGGRRAPLAVRGALRGIRAGVRLEPEHRRHADQIDVWNRVEHYETGHGQSRTSSLVEVQRGLDRQINEILRGARPLPAQRGVLIGVAGHPVLLEVFDHPHTLAEQWEAILSSVAVDALLAPAEPTPGFRARAFARRIRATAVAEAGLAGAAMAIAGNDHDLISARGLATSDRVIYAAVVNTRHQLVLAA
jgi:hypothetical protein